MVIKPKLCLCSYVRILSGSRQDPIRLRPLLAPLAKLREMALKQGNSSKTSFFHELVVVRLS